MEGKGDLKILPPTNREKWRVVGDRSPQTSPPKHIRTIPEILEAADTSIRDALTGLKNERAFESDFSQRIADGKPCVLFFVDANRLKLVNDVFGHGGNQKDETGKEETTTGNIFLRKLGIFLASHVEADTGEAYRLHGDEFALLLGENMPFAILEKRLSEIALLANENKGKDPLFPSMSIGAVIVDPSISKDQSYWTKRADSAMYKAKEAAKKDDPWKDTASELLQQMMKDELSSVTDSKAIGDIHRKYFTVPTTVNIWQEIEK